MSRSFVRFQNKILQENFSKHSIILYMKCDEGTRERFEKSIPHIIFQTAPFKVCKISNLLSTGIINCKKSLITSLT